jgi:hypothetical protein
MPQVNAVLAFVVALFAATACLPTAGTRQPDWAPPSNSKASLDEVSLLDRAFEECHLSTAADPRNRAFGAIILALQDKSWIVTQADVSRGTLRGKKCYRNQPGRCAEVAFYSDALGRIYARPSSSDRAIMSDLDRWLIDLEDAYAKYRCYTDDALRDEMKKLGIAL